MKKGTKTMLGEAVREFDNGADVVIDPGVSRFWLDKEEFEMIKLPELNEGEQKYYDEVKQAENGNKIKMVGDVIYDYEYDDDHCFTPEEVYRTIEAIVKGGYNQ